MSVLCRPRVAFDIAIAQVQEVRMTGIDHEVLCEAQKWRPAALLPLLGQSAGLLVLEFGNDLAIEIFRKSAIRG